MDIYIYYGLGILAFIITITAQISVSAAFSRYKKVNNSSNLSGFEVAKKILDENGLDDIYIIEIKNNSGDHYDSGSKVIRLSSEVFHGETITAASVAAHEAGHAIQHKEGNTFIKLRKFIFPLVRLSSQFGYIVILLGLFFNMMQLFYLGIVMLSVILLFQLFTLPVELDASNKALENLEKYKLLNADELSDSKKVLKAAAYTYVASLATTVLEILRLLFIARNRD